MVSREISIILPCYNEERNIQKVVEEIKEFCSDFFSKYEIIIVDDGSHYSTIKILKEMSKEYPQIKVIYHGKNKGYGMALKSGFKIASMEYIFFTDSDRQFFIQDIKDFFNVLDKYNPDIIIGYRKKRKDSLLRKFLSKGYAFLVRILLKLKVKDVNCAFKLFKKDFIKDVDIISKSFVVNAELIKKGLLKDLKIFQLPVRHRTRLSGKSTVRFKHFLITLKELLNLRRCF